MALFESSSDAVVSFGTDGRILTLNPRTQSLFGYREADLIGHPVALLLAATRPRPGRPATPSDVLPPELTSGEAQVRLGRRAAGSAFAGDVLVMAVDGDPAFPIATFRNAAARPP